MPKDTTKGSAKPRPWDQRIAEMNNKGWFAIETPRDSSMPYKAFKAPFLAYRIDDGVEEQWHGCQSWEQARDVAYFLNAHEATKESFLSAIFRK